jgi:hypothetical protein
MELEYKRENVQRVSNAILSAIAARDSRIQLRWVSSSGSVTTVGSVQTMSNRRIQCISGFLNGIMYGFEDVSILVGSGQMATAKLI